MWALLFKVSAYNRRYRVGKPGILNNYGAQTMIELKTSPDHLHSIASNVRRTDPADIAHDLNSAAHDLKNLLDYAERIERTANQMSAEINSIRIQRDDAAAGLLAIFRPELESMIAQAVETVWDADDVMRDTVRDMIRGGDIVVSIDLS